MQSQKNRFFFQELIFHLNRLPLYMIIIKLQSTTTYWRDFFPPPIALERSMPTSNFMIV